MQLGKVFGFASALAIVATAAPGPHLTPALAPRTVEEKRYSPAAVGGASAGAVAAIAAFGVIGIAADVGGAVALLAHDDTKERKLFTVKMVNALKQQAPDKNIVICNVGYSLSCTPETKTTVYYKTHLRHKVSYDVLIFGNGCTFDRKGHGGYQNWAYSTTAGCQVLSVNPDAWMPQAV